MQGIAEAENIKKYFYHICHSRQKFDVSLSVAINTDPKIVPIHVICAKTTFVRNTDNV